LITRGSAAWIRQDPDRGARELLVLSATTRARPSERNSICAHPDEGDDLRPVPSDLGTDATCAAPEVGEVKLVGIRGRSVYEIGHPDPAFQKVAPFRWRQEAIREASLVQRTPEAIAGPREVQPDRARPEARVDPDEEHVQSGRDYVWNCFAVCRLEFVPRGPIGNRLHHAAVSAPMRRFVLLVAAVSLVTCTASPAVQPSPPSPTVRLDPVGNVLPPVTDETTWKALAARPVQLVSVAPGSECPITPTRQLSSATGAVAGSGPVYAVGNVISYGARTSDGIFPAKVLWVAAPDYPGPALVRGRQLDGPGGLFFSNSRRVIELRFDLDTRVRAGASDQGWRYLPSTVNVEGPGCYGFQIDGPGWMSTIVMRALP